MFITQFYAIQSIPHTLVDLKRSLLASLGGYSNGFTQEEVVQVKDQLAPFAHPHLIYNIDLYDSGDVRAYANLDENICSVHISKGIWKEGGLRFWEEGLIKKGNRNELAAVIGHEMAHCAQLTEPDLINKAAANNVGRNWLEFHADYLGMVIMTKAGFEPAAAVGMWERMADEQLPISYSVNHPANSDRAEMLRRKLPEVKELRPQIQ